MKLCKQVFTVGYEGFSIDNFLAQLKRLGIDTLVDVRQLPLSRKKGFSKRVLAKALAANGVKYQHIRELGCPKPIRDQYRQDGDWASYVKSYNAYLEHQQTETLADLAVKAGQERCALMCFEADYRLCHRTLIADKLVASHGFVTTHLGKFRTSLAVA